MTVFIDSKSISRNLLRGDCRRNIFSYFALLKTADLGFKPWPYGYKTALYNTVKTSCNSTDLLQIGFIKEKIMRV